MTITTYQIQEKFGDLDKRIKFLVIQNLEKAIGDDNTKFTSIIGPDGFAYSFRTDVINPDFIEVFRQDFYD
ncbi:MAG: hypothetical protein AABW56_01355 [Nanoarchaeota archaeon]